MEQQILNQYDKRAFRYYSACVLCVDNFPTDDSNDGELETFTLMRWKVDKKANRHDVDKPTPHLGYY